MWTPDPVPCLGENFSYMDIYIALLYYDYFLTLPSEIAHIWSRKFRYVTLLYIGCRYALAANIVYMVGSSGLVSSVSPPSSVWRCSLITLIAWVRHFDWFIRTITYDDND
jgi:hypothetical protein